MHLKPAYVFLALLALGSATALATKPSCGMERIAPSRKGSAAKVKSLLLELSKLFRSSHVAVLEDLDRPTLVIGGVSASEFQDAMEKVYRFRKELKEYENAAKALQDAAREGNIRGFGVTSVEKAANRVALWGGGAAAAVACCFLVPPEAHAIFPLLAKAFAAFSTLKALRCMRTVDDNLTRTTGIAESNLWPALGPTQGPLQYWLKQHYDGVLNDFVVILAHESAGAIANWIRSPDRKGPLSFQRGVEIPMRP